MLGLITQKEEFLFPDSPLSALPEKIKIASAKNGMRGIQILLKTSENVEFSIDTDCFDIEFFKMKALYVEYNTGDGVEQGGAMVILSETKPTYAIRKAPFYEYDCLIPLDNSIVEPDKGVAAAYITLKPKCDTPAGDYSVNLTAKSGDECYSCSVEIKVYSASIPLGTFDVTNWFGLDTMERFHDVNRKEESFLPVLKDYIKAMRRTHQNVFFLALESGECTISKNPYEFSFETYAPIIKAFFDSGMDKMEIGTLLSRSFDEKGERNHYCKNFSCSMAQDILFDTVEGYSICAKYVKALAEFLKKYGWEDKILFHIHDEPDIHYKDEETLENRRKEYYLAVNLVKKYLPNVKIVEAVGSSKFYGGIDIWTPVTASYERLKDEFDLFTELGETVWNYVCCGPQGNWLNRFSDFHLIKGRILFWGFAKNKIKGYLHWGFNRFPDGMNPFETTSCPNNTGIGTNFPCGDSFIALPGENGKAWLTMRLEASRRGAEDVMLLQALREKDKELFDKILGEIFTSNTEYEIDTDKFEMAYEKLLSALS